MDILINAVIATSAILGFFFTTRARRRDKKMGAIIGLLGQPLWFYTVGFSGWGVLIVAVFFTARYLQIAITNWRDPKLFKAKIINL